MGTSKLCQNLGKNLEKCVCTYSSCMKRGKCCECIDFHRERNEIPGCFFSPEVESTYDRSIERFIASHK